MTTKRDIVRRVAEKTALTQAQTADVLSHSFAAIVESVLEEGRIELRNFGVFEVRLRRARKARDPRNGETLVVPERKAVVFRPGRAFEARLAALNPRPGPSVLRKRSSRSSLERD